MMVHVKIDNVFKYYMEEVPDDFESMKKAYPIILSPFLVAVYEYRGWGKWTVITKVSSIDIDNEPEFKEMVYKINSKATKLHGNNIGLIDTPKYATIYETTIPEIYPDNFLSIAQMVANDKGELIADHIGAKINPDYVKTTNWTEEEELEMSEDIGKFIAPVNVAISFMHCKNVHLIDEPLTRQRRRKLERKGGIRYKVLDIEPFKKQVRRETQPGESQLQRALHICRGHFATYTDEKPLFGKVTGTFWKPMHVRGNKSQGQVVKDYNIKLDDK